MWGWGRPRRDLPEVNYAENSDSDSEDEIGLPADAFNNAFNSPPVTPPPQQPVHTKEGSPQELFVPQLNDNVDEVLEEVQYRLGDIQQVEEEIEELTDLFEDTEFGVDPPKSTGNEEVVCFNFKVPGEAEVSAGNNMPNNQNNGGGGPGGPPAPPPPGGPPGPGGPGGPPPPPIPSTTTGRTRQMATKQTSKHATLRSNSTPMTSDFGLHRLKTKWRWLLSAASG